MRSATSLIVAVVCHAGLFGVGALVSRDAARSDVQEAQPEKIEMEIVAARPDPVSNVSPATRSEAPRPRAPSRARAKAQPVPEALVDDEAPTDAPAVEQAPKTLDVVPGKAVIALPTAALAPGPSVDRSVGSSIVAKPRYRSNPKPDYPIPSLRRHEEGIVLLNVQVEADGRPSAITLKQSSGHPLLDASALDAVRRWTFEPARAGGVPMSSLAIVPVRFSTEDP